MRLRKFCLFFVVIILILPFSAVKAQTQPSTLVVISPRAGEALVGQIEISGVTDLPGFQRVEVEYRYTNDPKDTWFLIAESDKAVNPGKIADWDTSLISDSTYDLRVTVFLKDGQTQSITVAGLRVRNYTPVETATPAGQGLMASSQTPQTTAIATRTPRPTPVPVSANPAVLNQSDLNSSLIRGGIAGLGFFIVFGIYWITKKSLR